MKIITNNKAYVQYIDIAYLVKSKSYKQVPDSISDKCFSDLFICNKYNKYNFMEFNKKEEIEFFRKLDYSVDFLEVENLTNEQIIQMIFTIRKIKNKINDKFEGMSNREKYLNIYMLNEIQLLDFKIQSFMDIIAIRNGKLKIELPDLDVSNNKLIKVIRRMTSR